MAKVDTAQLADILGKTDNAAFEQQVNAAVADLERQLGYPLCGTTELETRTFTYQDGYLWLKTHPFYDLSELVIVRNSLGNPAEETVELADLQYGQNGKLFGEWFNGIKICDTCLKPTCPCFDNCDYVRVTASWGFCPPVVEDESGDADNTFCCIPDDLYNVLVEAVRQGTDPKSDIQSENVGTRSYSKFAKSYASVWEKYASVIEFYRLREPRL